MALTKVSTGMLSADAASVDLNIDAGTMFIDASANRVGIGNTSPATALDVTGTVTADGLTTDDDVSGISTLGRYSSGFAYSLVRPSATATGIEIRTNAGNALAHFLNDGTTTLHHNGSAKLTTLSSGIDVTGTVTADGVDSQLSGNGGLPVSSGTTQTYGSLRVGATSFNTILDIGSAGATGAWLQASDKTALGTNYSLLLNPNGGNVGIGTSSPSSFSSNANNLVVGSGSGTEGITINSGSANYGTIYFADGTSGSAAYAGNINYNHADNSMRLGTNGSTTDVVIDASANVGIGAVPKAWTLFDVLQIGDGGSIASVNTSSKTARLGSNLYYDGAWKRMATGTATSYVQYNGDHIWNSTASGTADVGFTETERLRIDGATGNVGIGTSSITSNTILHMKDTDTQIELESTNGSNSAFIDFDGTNLQLSTNRNMIDGAFSNTGKSSAGIFLVGESGGSLIRFGTASANNTTPTTKMTVDASGNVGIGLTPTEHLHVGGRANAVLELQSSTTTGTGRVNFNDGANSGQILYSHNTNTMDFYSGGSYAMRLTSTGITAPQGIFIGGTGAANKLEDYEEGTWTPTLYYQNQTGVTRTYTEQTGYYTKIGNTVTVWCTLRGGTSNSGSYANDNIGISGLPFSVITTALTPVKQAGFAGTASVGTLYMQISSSTALLLSPTGQNNLGDDLGAGATYSLNFSGSYNTTE